MEKVKLSGSQESLLRHMYMAQMSELANSLGITGLSPIAKPPLTDAVWERFAASVHAARLGALVRANSKVPSSIESQFVVLSS